jgi:hypothetical protein
MSLDNGTPGGRNGKSGKKGGDGFVIAISLGCSVPEAARRAGIGTSTAYRRLTDPAVRKAISKARDDLLGQAIGKLAAAGCDAVDALVSNLQDASPLVRNKAAGLILANMLQGYTLSEIVRRLEALEEER